MGEFVTGAGDFHVEVSEGDAGPVVVVRGEIDMVTSGQLWEAVVDSLDTSEMVTLDIAGVSFLDSAGLALLVRAYQRLAAHGGRLRVRNVTRPAEIAMEVAGVLRLFGGDEPQPAPPVPS